MKNLERPSIPVNVLFGAPVAYLRLPDPVKLKSLVYCVSVCVCVWRVMDKIFARLYDSH